MPSWVSNGKTYTGCSEINSAGKPWCKVREKGCGSVNGEGAGLLSWRLYLSSAHSHAYCKAPTPRLAYSLEHLARRLFRWILIISTCTYEQGTVLGGTIAHRARGYDPRGLNPALGGMLCVAISQDLLARGGLAAMIDRGDR